jgi:hypothetical protein
MSGEQAQDNQLTVSQNPVLAAQYRTILDINHVEMLKQMAKNTTPVGHLRPYASNGCVVR